MVGVGVRGERVRALVRAWLFARGHAARISQKKNKKNKTDASSIDMGLGLDQCLHYLQPIVLFNFWVIIHGRARAWATS
jgi:hypothetical protein